MSKAEIAGKLITLLYDLTLSKKVSWIFQNNGNLQAEVEGKEFVLTVDADCSYDDGTDESKSVLREFEVLSKGPLAGLRLAMLHGQMSTDEKQAVVGF